jgi:hypothetical protein
LQDKKKWRKFEINRRRLKAEGRGEDGKGY